MSVLAGIRTKLESLRSRDAGREVFGASAHNYLATPVPVAEVEQLERKHGVRLPAEYREWILEVGVGAGPGYGLSPLSPLELDSFPRVVSTITSKDGSSVSAGTPKRPAFAQAASLARPFLLRRAWEGLILYDWPPIPATVTPYDGCIELNTIGCGYFSFLVVNGESAGQVWTDTMAAMREGSIAPTGQSFSQWYESWLDQSLAEVSQA